MVDADADDDVEALLIPPDRLHALIVVEAECGERIVRALILRRVALIESGGSGPVLIGDLRSPDMLRLENFLPRNSQPHHAVYPSRERFRSSTRICLRCGDRIVAVLLAPINPPRRSGERISVSGGEK